MITNTSSKVTANHNNPQKYPEITLTDEQKLGFLRTEDESAHKPNSVQVNDTNVNQITEHVPKIQH